MLPVEMSSAPWYVDKIQPGPFCKASPGFRPIYPLVQHDKLMVAWGRAYMHACTTKNDAPCRDIPNEKYRSSVHV